MSAVGPLTTPVKEPLLMLCHRIPYPPNKGDKIRSYHLLRHLCERFDVYLVAFIDDPDDWQYVDVLGQWCAEIHLDTRPALRPSFRLVTDMLAGKPLTLSLYFSAAVQAWVDEKVAAHTIQYALVYSSAMGQYLMTGTLTELSTVVDFVDVDSEKWQQYASRKWWPLSWVYRREARALRRFELDLHAAASASLFVSPAEAAVFRQFNPAPEIPVGHYWNGVDGAYFDPAIALDNPYRDNERALVFTGAMDYWPNEDAVEWFAREHLPAFRAIDPRLTFYIVGSNPSRRVQALADLSGVVVTGRVADVRPFLRYCLAAVAPMRVARGIQNKVLEAMAMARPVLVSEPGLEGISAEDGRHVLVANSVPEAVCQLETLLRGDWPELGHSARQYVLSHFNWQRNLALVDAYFDPIQSSGRQPGESDHG